MPDGGCGCGRCGNEVIAASCATLPRQGRRERRTLRAGSAARRNPGSSRGRAFAAFGAARRRVTAHRRALPGAPGHDAGRGVASLRHRGHDQVGAAHRVAAGEDPRMAGLVGPAAVARQRLTSRRPPSVASKPASRSHDGASAENPNAMVTTSAAIRASLPGTGSIPRRPRASAADADGRGTPAPRRRAARRPAPARRRRPSRARTRRPQPAARRSRRRSGRRRTRRHDALCATRPSMLGRRSRARCLRPA